MDYSSLTGKSHKIFEPIFDILDLFIASVPVILQKDFQNLSLESSNRYGYLGLSVLFNESNGLDVDMLHIFNKVNQQTQLAQYGDMCKAGFSALTKNLGKIVAILVVDLLKSSDYFERLKESDIYQFVRHVRNGAAHNNHFFYESKTKKDILNCSLIWRGKEITADLEGKEVFDSFINCFDLLVLIYDLSGLIYEIENN